MKRLVSMAICGFVLAVTRPAATCQSATSAQDRLTGLEQQTQQYLHEQKPKLAIPLLREILSLDSGNLNANANLGILLYFQGNYREAIPTMRKAVEIQPDLWKIEALLGIAEKRSGDPVAAQRDLENAFPHLSEKNFQKEAGLELIELQSSLGQFGKALLVINRLEDLSPQDPHIIFVAYEISSQMMAQSMLSLLLVAPNSAEMNMIVARELGSQGEREKAIAKYREAIRLNPLLPGVHFELAEQLRGATDPKLSAQAEGEYKAATQANPYDEKAWGRLGEAMATRGDFANAEEAYRKALALQPTDAATKTDLAIALISTHRQTEAISLLESAVKEDPSDIAAHYRLNVLYRSKGRTADAQHEMDEYTHYKALKDKMDEVLRQMRSHSDPQ
jgi:Flp pilus assembly protein TadD